MDKASIEKLVQLAQRLSAGGQAEEAEAVREALSELGQKLGFITTGAAADQLGVSIPTVRRWTSRGTLDGFDTGTRLLVSQASVERLLRLREDLEAMDEEGNPTPEEIEQARGPHRGRGGGEKVA